ncbi:MAG: adenine deaminase, partial [Vicinamibacterales bacterium]
MNLAGFIEVARGAQPAELLLTNAQIVDLYTLDIIRGDLAIAAGRIAGIASAAEASRYGAAEIVDLRGQYVAPGFIDGHVHIESSLVNIPEFARAVVPGGVTTVITDPHEIANVLGMSGIRYMLEVAKWNPLSVFVMASSCVPAGPYESAGARLSSYDLENLLQDKWVLGLAEMMNYAGVLAGDPEVVAKIEAAGSRPLDGHAPGLRGMDLNAYAAAGIGSDHECTTREEALDRLRRGMIVMIREATPARNLQELLPLVTPKNARRFVFVTDDRNPIHLLEDGSIDGMIRQAITLGLDPLLAIQLGSLNAAEYFRLYDRGAIAPGKRADLVIFKDLRAPRATLVYRGGRLVARDGELLPYTRPTDPPTLPVSLSVPRSSLRFTVPATGKRIRVIEIVPNQIVTEAAVEEAKIADGSLVADPGRDLLKIALIERHTGSGRVGIGFVRGFGLKFGALASTVAHDAHNIIVAGADDESMRAAVEIILEMKGGLVAVAGREVVKLPLPIA